MFPLSFRKEEEFYVALTWIDKKLVAGHFEQSTCDKQKKCIFSPVVCEKRNDCNLIFSYSPHEDGWVDMEMFSTNDVPSNSYMAVGFSEDDSMGDDAVTQCVFLAGGEPTAHFSFNVGKSNVPPSDEIDKAAEEENLKLVHAHKGEDGMYCHWRQKNTNGESKFAPVLDKDHHIFLARGKARDGRSLDIHGLDPTSVNYPYITDKKLNMMKRGTNIPAPPNGTEAKVAEETSESSMDPQTRIWLIKVHGMLMIFAWIVMVASAVLSARYLRDHFSKSAPWGLKWWFHIHRTLNIAAVPLILISTLLIFIAKDWTWRGPSVNKSSSANTGAG
ncbi:hypothetical protein ANCDUO_22600, partial [Ancylostoma duodenale]